MRVEKRIALLGIAGTLVACAGSSGSDASHTPLPPAGDDLAEIQASDATRSDLGIAHWGIRTGDGNSIVVRGYDGSNAPMVEFGYATTRSASTTYAAYLRRDGHEATLKLSVTSNGVHASENTFGSDADAGHIVDRIIADFSHPSTGDNLLRPADDPAAGGGGLVTGNTCLVSNCGTSLTNSVGPGAQAVPACADPKAPNCGPAVGKAADSHDQATGTCTPDKAAYCFFVGKGLSSVQAAGIVGNLDQESGMNPTVPGGDPAHGIAQWLSGGRWDSKPNDNLQWFARQHGGCPDMLNTQLEFIWYELQTFPSYGLAQLQGATTVADATIAFQNRFEGCGACNQSGRIANASRALNAYGSSCSSPAAGP
jgi:hypothetical protein